MENIQEEELFPELATALYEANADNITCERYRELAQSSSEATALLVLRSIPNYKRSGNTPKERLAALEEARRAKENLDRLERKLLAAYILIRLRRIGNYFCVLTTILLLAYMIHHWIVTFLW